ncbi:MAG: GNAT family N-acetyltransferase [Sporolactobacillus sp.]|jgi:ribosomal protein S18 acetylase RimI-like enzyme|nr:GNAT family N-acetyltransferase [Sporolactobacillus sp.]
MLEQDRSVGLQFRRVDSARFGRAWQLLEQAFPAVELRSRRRARALLDNRKYRLLEAETDRRTFAGIIADWQLNDFRFIEHLAVDSSLRGRGVGSAMLRAYLIAEPRPVVLEVEEPKNDRQWQRIRFYRRLGFRLNPFGYRQPALQPLDTAAVKLSIMSRPGELSPATFRQVKKIIFRDVYGRA